MNQEDKLRDKFAKEAMTSVIQSWRGIRPVDFESNQGDVENIAINCYLIADAMMKEREKYIR